MRLTCLSRRPVAIVCALALLSSAAGAPIPASLTNQEASSGLKAALEAGSAAAVAKLGVENGFEQ
jgi:hypothetical protein